MSAAFLTTRTLPGLLLVVALADICFWRDTAFPGLGLAVFVAGLTLVLRWNRPEANIGGRVRLLAFLIAGAIAQAVIETGFCNVLMLILLTAGLAAESFFVGRTPGLDRWSAQARAFVLAPFRLVHLVFAVAHRHLFQSGLSGRVAAFFVVILPTVALVLVFGALFAAGNAVFELWTRQAFSWLCRLLPDLTIARIFFWGVMAVVSVAILWPSEAPHRTWNAPARLGRWPELLPASVATASSGLLLVALNGLFAVANGADAHFLWQGATLPNGVTYSGYVHQGVEVLIVAVLLSAFVLASVFNQPMSVAGRRGLKLLGGLWIAQNLVLLLGCARRLQLYVSAYDASVARLSTLIFLLLVAVGFALLGIMIVRGKVLAWLVGKALLASFLTLYTVQFLDLAGWVANYNEARWEADRSKTFDMEYLQQIGPAAWPALVRAEKLGAAAQFDPGSRTSMQAANEMENFTPRTRLDGRHWRQFSLRAWCNRRALVEETNNR